MIETITHAILALSALLIGAAGIVGIGRIVAGPTALDRIIASDLLVAIAIGGTALWIVHSEHHGLLIILLLLSMLGFTGATAIARLMGERVSMAKQAMDRLTNGEGEDAQ